MSAASAMETTPAAPVKAAPGTVAARAPAAVEKAAHAVKPSAAPRDGVQIISAAPAAVIKASVKPTISR